MTEQPTSPRATRSLYAKRLALSFASVAITLLFFEALARLFVPPPSPIRLRDGIYVGQLAKVNGRDTVLAHVGAPLEERKRPGEIRIAVLGESSIQGSPYGYWASAPTLLHDQLKALLPGRDVTVINMGRGAGYMIDSFYFLQSLERFAPDYVVVYQGGNDEYRRDREMCWPSTHPIAYSAYRWLLRRSRFVWSLRAELPVWIVRRRGIAVGEAPTIGSDLCEPNAAFRAWADVLVETGQSMGARVVVTSPVQSPLRWLERGVASAGTDVPLAPASREEPYRRVLACVLTDGCDVAATFAEASASPQNGAAYTPDGWVKPRTAAILASAREHGAVAIDFSDYLARRASGGLSPMLFSDEVHLSMEGYWRLAWEWTRRIAPELGANAPGEDPPRLDEDRYLRDVLAHGGNGGMGGDGTFGRACLLLHWANLYLRVNMPIVAANELRLAEALDAPAPGALPLTRSGTEAALLVGWLRRSIGLDSRLPPSLESRLPDVSVAELTRSLRAHPDCSDVGGPDLPVAVPSRVAESALFAIPPGEEELLATMLKDGAAPGCSFSGASVDRTYVRATYDCAGASHAVDLRHSSSPEAGLARTDQFVLVAVGTPPPAPLVASLAASLRAKEHAFRFIRVAGPPPDGAVAGSPHGARSLPSWVFGVGAAIAVIGLGRTIRRRRARGR